MPNISIIWPNNEPTGRHAINLFNGGFLYNSGNASVRLTIIIYK
jgi:hypothetical protein